MNHLTYDRQEKVTLESNLAHHPERRMIGHDSLGIQLCHQSLRVSGLGLFQTNINTGTGTPAVVILIADYSLTSLSLHSNPTVAY